MSLKAFHIVFITLSTLLSAGLAFWGFKNYRLSRETPDLALGLAGVVSLGLLIPYFRWFQKKMRRLAPFVIAGLMFLSSQPALACSVCYGDPNSPLTKGIKMGILSLAGLIYLLLGGIVLFTISCIRRHRMNSVATQGPNNQPD